MGSLSGLAGGTGLGVAHLLSAAAWRSALAANQNVMWGFGSRSAMRKSSGRFECAGVTKRSQLE